MPSGSSVSGASLDLSRARFEVVYHLACPGTEVETRARDICIEQTVEFPESAIPNPEIREQIVGRILAIEALDAGRFEARIAYPVEAAGSELTQFVNLLFGNISLKPGVRLVRFEVPDALADLYPGPRFGRDGLRTLVGVTDRPLLCTAIKPMGLGPHELADLAHRLALGGIHLIKDDHGLADQVFCPFDERVALCSEAVSRANRETGGNALYLPNVTAPAGEIGRRAHFAKEAGAGGLLFCPGLAGLDAVRALAADDRLDLPILSHPAFQGGHCIHPDSGVSHGALFGQLNRMAGADATIFPNWGGRFSFTREACLDLVEGTVRPMGSIRPIFPVPAGGMRLDRVAEMCDFYGPDVILLIGGDLHANGRDLIDNCRQFSNLSQQA
ncbi:RuBisCO large subunit C-terminal-like domain-containing protein [Imhoffiella purpurea]|uniref:Ribulose-1,5-bisphosphate carboxylase like protein n=1 Tax=Imhoffiella purpurea TaxID=1249627 RepID=W9W3K3_9GAMM|nr:RuBisCO large subunit C-terminal-like domain-containing protein [Imhoffiella purpurea]EXJ17145.1 ribulose-1,5-bisphosphate carboxylase like protein [Imhoffiella purpurea]